jgi:hypothetical protein
MNRVLLVSGLFALSTPLVLLDPNLLLYRKVFLHDSRLRIKSYSTPLRFLVHFLPFCEKKSGEEGFLVNPLGRFSLENF